MCYCLPSVLRGEGVSPRPHRWWTAELTCECGHPSSKISALTCSRITRIYTAVICLVSLWNFHNIGSLSYWTPGTSLLISPFHFHLSLVYTSVFIDSFLPLASFTNQYLFFLLLIVYFIMCFIYLRIFYSKAIYIFAALACLLF